MSDDYTTDNGTIYSVTPVYKNGFFGPYLSSYTVTITDPDGSTFTLSNLGTNSVAAPDTGNSSINLATFLGLGSASAVVAPGSTADISYSGLLGSNTFYIGGTAVITSGLSAGVSTTLNVDGGTASLGAGLASTLGNTTVNLTYGGSFVAGTGLVDFLGSTSIDYGAGGGTFIANAGGAFLNLSGSNIHDFKQAGDFIEFQGLSASATFYSLTNSGNNQVIKLYDDAGSSIASILVAGLNIINPFLPSIKAPKTYGCWFDAALDAQPELYSTTGPGPLTVTQSDGNTYVEPVASTCFLAGGHIATPSGTSKVETLRAGDEILAWENGRPTPRSLIWTGSRHVHVNKRLADCRLNGTPVRIIRGALGDESGQPIPENDLLVTPEHCLFLDGGFIPVRMLVNDISIFYDTTISSYTYYHIETETHAIICAEGALTESYLDSGNRRDGFTGSDIPAVGHNLENAGRDAWAKKAAAPLIVDRARVEPIHRALAARTGREWTAPNTTAEPDLHISLENGTIVTPLRRAKNIVLFSLPPGVRSIRLRSRIGRPSDTIGPFVDDRRNLGVLVGAVTLWASDATHTLDAHLTNPGLPGWHAIETAQMRWTDGNAFLPLPSDPDNQTILAVTIIDTPRYSALPEREHLQRAV